MNASPLDAALAVRSLRLIFWGGLFCVLDFRVTSKTIRQPGGEASGYSIDIVSDLVGTTMIALAVSRLGSLDVDERYRSAMRFALGMALYQVFSAFVDHFIFTPPAFFGFLGAVLALATLVAIVLFSSSMRRLCEVWGLDDVAPRWATNTMLFVLIYLVPLGLFYAAAAFAIVTGTSFNINLGPAVVPALLVLIIPLVHLFVCTSHMARAAEGTPWPSDPTSSTG